MATGYIFTKTGNSSTKVVHVTNDVVDLGRTKIFKGAVLIEENDSSLISIKEGGGNAMSLNIGAIVTIDGSAPAGTMEGIIDQLDAVFPDATTTGGGGSGVPGSSIKATLISGNISNGGTTITLASLAGVPVNVIMINDFPKSTGFTKTTANNHLDFTDGTTVSIADIVVFL